LRIYPNMIISQTYPSQMKSRISRIMGLIALFVFFSLTAAAQTVFVIDLKGDVDPSTAHHVARGLDEAKKEKADWIILHINTFGGDIVSADTIRLALLACPIPIAAYINRNAASAGAIISLACDSIFMSPGSTIGAATVVDGGTHNAAPDKYQSYYRGIVRAMATTNGRSPAIAEKMIDQDLQLDTIDVNGNAVSFTPEQSLTSKPISPAGQVITFTTEEAIKYHFCEGMINTLAEVPAALGLPNAKVIQYKSSATNSIIEFLVLPAVSSVLMLIIFWGIILEVKMPGFGVPGIAALVAIVLFFAPHYIDGVADKWEILLFALGLALIVLEVFVIPGFGVAGVAGIISTFAGLVGAMVPNAGLDFTQVEKNDILFASTMVIGGLMISIILAVLAAKYLTNRKSAYPIVDHDTQQASKGYIATNRKFAGMVGQEGLATTDLKPSGFIEIDGTRIDAEAEGGFIARDSRVIVIGVKSNILSVRKV
jgi:membrane-bound serine protease (ClpP class)